MRPPILVFVGGFLGCGKTTLILRAAKLLAGRGTRVAAIMNDQAAGLVDTQFAESEHLVATEVAGGCFCCRFSDLLAAANQLKAYQPEVIFAEPVGSCIDLSATILQPLRAYHAGDFRLAPLTVLVDPELARQIADGREREHVAYLFRNQLAESDLLCLTKSDLYSEPAPLPYAADFTLSGRTGAGVEAWLAEVLEGGREAGSRVLEVDYQRYADAEAALGWLNLDAGIRLDRPLSPASVAGPLLDDLDRALQAEGIRVAHLKIFDRADTGHVKVSLVATGEEPVAEGDLMAEPAPDHDLLINLRASADPARLDRIVQDAIMAIRGKVEIRRSGAFCPAPPQPEYRMEKQ
jgi:hypothetical protein